MSKQNIFITSDHHFNHINIIKYCNRPFKDVNEMNKELIKKWNGVVKPNDIVYHLGDFHLGHKDEIKRVVSQLNGKIFLIRGNHDRNTVSTYTEAGLTVLKNAPIILEDYKIILSHRPLLDSIIPENFINIHGHIHNHKLEDDYDTNLYSPEKHLNVSIDVTNFKPMQFK